MRSPFLPGAGARHRRRPRLRLALLALALLLGASAAAVLASATGASHSVRLMHRAQPLEGPEPVVLPLHAALSQNARAARAIDRVLAYTPFIKAGLPRRRLIALTFDDGPSPYTRVIVRLLVKLRVPATFFVVGQQLDYFSAGLRDELRNGFTVGDHTENHPPLTALTSARQYLQIHMDALRLHHFSGLWPRLFRPPYGLWDSRTLAILHRLRMLMVMWSDDPADWSRPGTQAIVERVLARARPGAIVELHDGGGDRSQTAAALGAIVSALRKRHYQFVTVPQLLAGDPPPRHQHLSHLIE